MKGLVLGLLGVVSCLAAEVEVWQVLEGRDLEQSLRVRQLEEAENKVFVKVNWQELGEELAPRTEQPGSVRSGDGVGRNSGEERSIRFQFPETGSVSCSISPSNLMVPELASKMEGLAAYSGPCSDGSRVFLNGELFLADSLSATFLLSDGDFIYVDSAFEGSDVYVVYRSSDVIKAANTGSNHDDDSFHCGVEDVQSEDHHRRVLLEEGKSTSSSSSPSLRKLDSSTGSSQGHIFRLAMIATPNYSQFHGNTPNSVMSSLLTLMTRVNGVYMRELGVFFQFIADQDQLICIKNAGDSLCDNLSLDSSIINENGGFISSKGVAFADYDIGHSVTTGSGGLASYPGLCDGSKARGTTGIGSPVGDPFAIDYVAHELGHQLLGAHSFRDCGGSTSNRMKDGAVEPGSGNSIMGYAGICGASYNLQRKSDPYFNSNNLDQMKTYILGKAANGCGQTVVSSKSTASVEAPTKTCTLPVDSSFQLRGRGVNSQFYSFDRVDKTNSKTIFEDFTDLNVPRFRSWKPTASKSRFFPNLNFQVNGISQKVEIVPKSSKQMTFRFTGRSLYDTGATTESHDAQVVGSFAFEDIVVTFDGSKTGLSLNPFAGNSLTPFTSTEVTWDVGNSQSLAGSVSISIARNTLPKTTQSDVDNFRFDYESDVKDLEWYKVATVPNSGRATVKVPQLVVNEPIEVIVMIRSADDKYCFFFDIQSGITLEAAEGTINGERDLLDDEVEEPNGKPFVVPLVLTAVAIVGLMALAGMIAIFRVHRRNSRNRRVEQTSPNEQIQQVTSFQNYFKY